MPCPSGILWPMPCSLLGGDRDLVASLQAAGAALQRVLSVAAFTCVCAVHRCSRHRVLSLRGKANSISTRNEAYFPGHGAPWHVRGMPPTPVPHPHFANPLAPLSHHHNAHPSAQKHIAMLALHCPMSLPQPLGRKPSGVA